MGKPDSEAVVTNGLANLQVVKSTVDDTVEHNIEIVSHVQDSFGQEFFDLNDSLARARQTLSQSSPLVTSVEFCQDAQGSLDEHRVGISAGQLDDDPHTNVTTDDDLKKSYTNSLLTTNPSSDIVGNGTADSGEDSSVPLVDVDPGGAISMSYSSRTCRSVSSVSIILKCIMEISFSNRVVLSLESSTSLSLPCMMKMMVDSSWVAVANL